MLDELRMDIIICRTGIPGNGVGDDAIVGFITKMNRSQYCSKKRDLLFLYKN